jgi:23S rRNA (guanosine2251-2'-O)-methyltransferase
MSARIILSNIRSIEECLRINPHRITKLLIPKGITSKRIENLKALALQQAIPIETNPKSDPEEPVLAFLKDYQYSDFDLLVQKLQIQISKNAQYPVVLFLDSITDPQNLGAIIRTAAFMGIDGIIIPKDRAAGITDTVFKVASGGVEHVHICQATNLVSALKALKEIGFWIAGLSEHAKEDIRHIKKNSPLGLVLGNEEKGIRPLLQQNCDYLVKISSKGSLQSLNASVAAALAMAAVCLSPDL